ncbi:MAG: hypothetical protein JSV44_08495, partial [Candidatus Zixiibacteriota bacterium]
MTRYRKFLEYAGFAFVGGFFVSTTFSKALAQSFLGLTLLSALLILIFTKQFRRPLPRDGFVLFVILFLAWSFLGAFFGTDTSRSLSAMKEEWMFLVIPAVAILIRDERKLLIWLKMFAVSAAVVSLYAVWQHFSGIDLYRGGTLVPAPSSGYRALGTFSNVMTFGNYFAVTAFFLLGAALFLQKLWHRALFYGGFFLSALASLLSYGRGPFGAIVAGLIVYFFFIPKQLSKY